ncbi:MAG: phage portal protein [Parvularcula sp.]
MFSLFNRSPEAPQKKSSVLSELIALHGPGTARWSGRDSVSLAASGYGRNVISYRCVQMIADAAASVRLFVAKDGLRDGDHAIGQLLNHPNMDMTGQALREAIFGHLQIHGNAYLEIIGDRSSPMGLRVLRPDRMSVEPDHQGWPRAWIYRTGQKKRRIEKDANGLLPIIHLRLFNPLNDQYGQSPMQVAANAVDLHNAAVDWNKALLDNAARPSGALVYRGVDGAPNLTGDQFSRLKTELSETFASGRNAGRPMVLDGGLDWRPMGMTPAEMDFEGLKNGAARDIALAFGVPPMLLGIPGDNTYSNYQQAVLAFWRQTVLPLVGKVAEALSASFELGDRTIRYDIDDIDALVDSRTSRMTAILNADFLTRAEKRNALGFPPEPRGEG